MIEIKSLSLTYFRDIDHNIVPKLSSTIIFYQLQVDKQVCTTEKYIWQKIRNYIKGSYLYLLPNTSGHFSHGYATDKLQDWNKY